MLVRRDAPLVDGASLHNPPDMHETHVERAARLTANEIVGNVRSGHGAGNSTSEFVRLSIEIASGRR
jgi:hypothetical protein